VEKYICIINNDMSYEKILMDKFLSQGGRVNDVEGDTRAIQDRVLRGTNVDSMYKLGRLIQTSSSPFFEKL
jgi:hypothetical protein